MGPMAPSFRVPVKPPSEEPPSAGLLSEAPLALAPAALPPLLPLVLPLLPQAVSRAKHIAQDSRSAMIFFIFVSSFISCPFGTQPNCSQMKIWSFGSIASSLYSYQKHLCCF